jgi:protein-tyrosine-phosphatase
MKTIIFICKYNVFRSKIAEAYFNKTNKNKNWKAVSRGFIMGGSPDKTQINLLDRILGIKIKLTQKSVNLKELKKADKIIVVADDIPEVMFNYQLKNLRKKLVIWDIKDEQKGNEKNIRKTIGKIKKKVDVLVKELEKRK